MNHSKTEKTSVIQWDQQTATFHLQTKTTSYVMQVRDGGYLMHLYWGRRIHSYHGATSVQYWDRGFSANPISEDRTFSLDTLPQEYPQFGNTDFRQPAYQVIDENGSTVSDLRYQSFSMKKGKPLLDGLPATYVENEREAETLEIVLKDEVSGLHVFLQYSVFPHLDGITRSVRFEHKGVAPIRLLEAASVNVDFRDDQFEMITLYGAHERERMIERTPLRHGTQAIESRRGASSHQQNPFIALVREETREESGEAYGISLVYSGNFRASVEVDSFHHSRLTMGIHPFSFEWDLQPGASFQTPEAVLVYSQKGLGGMSRTYHRLYRTRLARGVHRDRERPILLNNWEATYFTFDEKSILEIAKKGAGLGIELFVLDDGWFGKRDDDNSSLGDWYVNESKLPHGLGSLAKKVNDLDLQFGLWFEPEMVSKDSELYRKHPDWCLHVPHRRRSTSRNQLVLDLSRDEVCQYIIDSVSEILEQAPIAYVKWDMNRHMTEVWSATLPSDRQQEVYHRYILGLYRIMDTMTSRFPDILFESCSGGGGRYDPGMLYYMPQTWTSDNTDGISRLKIQYGTSLVYPVISMGAHVSASPNHQVQRETSLELRGHVAMSGNLGYELDVTKLSEAEEKEVAEQVKAYQNIRSIVQFGDFYRLRSPFEGDEASWMFVSEGKEKAVFFHVVVFDEGNSTFRSVRMAGLDPEKSYYIQELGEAYGGDELMHAGIAIPKRRGDFKSVMWSLVAT